jgi:hypothetical protein
MVRAGFRNVIIQAETGQGQSVIDDYFTEHGMKKTRGGQLGFSGLLRTHQARLDALHFIQLFLWIGGRPRKGDAFMNELMDAHELYVSTRRGLLGSVGDPIDVNDAYSLLTSLNGTISLCQCPCDRKMLGLQVDSLDARYTCPCNITSRRTTLDQRNNDGYPTVTSQQTVRDES